MKINLLLPLVLMFIFSVSCTNNKEAGYLSEDLEEMKLAGQVKKVKHYMDSDIEEIFFNPNGLKQKILEYKGGVLESTKLFKYNKNNLLIKESLIYKNKVVGYDLYEYNAKKQLVKSRHYNGDNVLVGFITFEYDTKGNNVKYVMYDSEVAWSENNQIVLDEVVLLQYDDLNNVVSEKIISGFDKTPIVEKEKKYENSNLISVEETELKTGEKKTFIYNYNKYGDITMIKNDNFTSYLEYDYDRFKNWIKFNYSVKDLDAEVSEKREISYY